MRKSNLILIGALAALSAAPAIADAAPSDASARLQPAVNQGDTAQLIPAQYYYPGVRHYRYRHYYRPWRHYYYPYGYYRPYYYGYYPYGYYRPHYRHWRYPYHHRYYYH